jgi:hypothetical protein
MSFSANRENLLPSTEYKGHMLQNLKMPEFHEIGTPGYQRQRRVA